MENTKGLPPNAVLDLLLDAICVVDARGVFLSISGACESIFGYAPEDMIGRQMLDFVHHEDRERTLRQADRIMDGYLQRHFENRYVRKDGSVAHIMWSARWSPTDKVRVAVARDVTIREQGQSLTESVPRWRLSASPPRLIAPCATEIPLSAQDYTVMLSLASGGECVSREAIVNALGEDLLLYDQRRLDTQMRRLRRKVEEFCGRRLPVRTLRGIGFHFYDEVEVCR